MQCSDQNRASVAALVAEIAGSPIRVAQRPALLPAGFEDVDVAILAWLADEGQRFRRHALMM